ncbi:MAG: hypothetical protein J5855_05745 [Mailhella sp.]|nr:hypothetical protein [Mailhella sp.]
MDRRFLEDTALHNPELFKAILQFNAGHCFLPQPKAMLDSLPLQAADLWQDRYFRHAAVSDPAAAGWWGFEHENCRFALLGKETLLKLCRRFSASVLGERIAHVIAREPQAQLKAKLGPELYRYAISRGRYQSGFLGKTFLSHLGPGSVADQFDMLTEVVLGLITDGWSDELDEMLGLPKQGSELEAAPAIALGPEHHAAFRFMLKKILLREVAPEWAPCFD